MMTFHKRFTCRSNVSLCVCVQIQLDEGSFPKQLEVDILFEPFMVNYENEEVNNVYLNGSEEVWSANIKRAISSLFQVQGSNTGAFVSNEVRNGRTLTEYLTNKNISH